MALVTLSPNNKKSLIAAAWVHGVFFLCLLMSLLVEACAPKETIHVFALHSVAAELPPKPQVAQKSVEPKVPDQAPAAQPTKRMSYEDFLKQQGKPKRARVAQQQKKAPKKVQLNSVTRELRDALSASQEAPTDRAELNAYIMQLKQRIDRVWQKPKSLAGQQLTAVAEFTVEPSGAITRVHITRPSGHTSFDDSVVRAFKRTSKAGTPPKGKRYTFSLAFQMVE